jgi:hypothetical protein
LFLEGPQTNSVRAHKKQKEERKEKKRVEKTTNYEPTATATAAPRQA